METPKKKEVVKYFENAKEVESVFGNKFILGEIYMSDLFGILGRVKGKTNVSHTVWNPKQGYAKILSYKEPKEKTYKITKEQILNLHSYYVCPKMELERMFPEVFETKLTVGKWYKKTWKDGDVDLFPVYEIVQNGNILDKGNYFRNGELLNKAGSYGNISCLTDSRVVITEATEQEVTEALTKEAVKRGFKEGGYFNSVHDSDGEADKTPCEGKIRFHHGGRLDFGVGNGLIFCDGKWAEIIPTITKQEAEAKLNCKII